MNGYESGKREEEKKTALEGKEKKGMQGEPLLAKVEAFIREHDLIKEGDRVAVAFSGGADSLFLLLSLKALEIPHVTLSAIHVNHNLRGRESDEDEAFVRGFCKGQDIPLQVFSVPVRERAGTDKLSIEEAARLLRREVFSDCLKKKYCTSIALGHHQNDQAETLLFRLARGTSLRGLAGIRPKSGALIHPLLNIKKQEMEDWLRQRGYSWRTDRTNASVEYSRNALRHKVLPYLEEHLNAGVIGHLAATASDLLLADEYLSAEAEKHWKNYIRIRQERGQDIYVLDAGILAEPAILRRYILRNLLEKIAQRAKDIGRIQILQIEDLLTGRAGRRADLIYEMKAVRTAAAVEICRQDPDELFFPKGIEESGNPRGGSAENQRPDETIAEKASVRITAAMLEQTLRTGRSMEVHFDGFLITFQLVEGKLEAGRKTLSKPYTKEMDYDNMNPSLTLRYRRPGDYLSIRSDGARQKLKQLFIDRKIPREKRGQVLLLAEGPEDIKEPNAGGTKEEKSKVTSGREIYWAVGERMSERCKITAETRRILIVSCEKESHPLTGEGKQSSKGKK